MDIRSLRKEGHSIKAIARMTGRSRNTIRRVLRDAEFTGFREPQRHSCLDSFKDYLCRRYEECGLSAVRLLPEIQAMGYTGSIATLRRYLHSLKPEQERMRKLTVRFETPPGKQAQAAWAYCGPDPAGHIFPVYVFVMVLGFSRMLYIEFTSSMKLPALIRCHRQIDLGNLIALAITIFLCYVFGLRGFWLFAASVVLWFPVLVVWTFIFLRIVRPRFEPYVGKEGENEQHSRS